MSKRFVIQGVNPATGGIAVLTLLAPSALSAKEQAESAGLLYVVVREDDGTGEPDDGRDRDRVIDGKIGK